MTSNGVLGQLPMCQIERDPLQPREVFAGIEDLAESLASHGLLQPVSVRKVGEKYRIVAGERRFRAATMLGWATIPAMIVEADDATAFELQVLENLARESMNPVEEAKALKRMMDTGLTPAEVGKRVGLGENGWQVTFKTTLLDCIPEIQHLVQTGQLANRRAVNAVKLTRNGQLKVLRIMNQRLMTEREFATLCQKVWAEENEVEMFPEMKVSKEAREAVSTFDRALSGMGDSLRLLDSIPADVAGAALAHRSTETLDEIIRQLRRIKLAMESHTGKQIELKEEAS